MNRIAPQPKTNDDTWSKAAILELFALPLNDLMFRAQTVLRENFTANEIQLSSLLSFKTGNCGEDCGYCAQSKRNKTALEPSEGMLELEDVIAAAKRAKEAGAGRFCMSAAWRQLRNADLDSVAELVENVKGLGLETCMTLGMVDEAQASRLKEAGLDYYNHNVDTSPEYYDKVITTRTFADRLETIAAVRKAGLKVCSGGIVGMGEAREDRAGMLEVLANLDPAPESVPINMLVPIPGTKMEDMPAFDPLELVRTIAVARITMPTSYVRLSAGRKALSKEAQAMCFLAGANSVFYGEKLLTTDNAERDDDLAMFADFGLRPEAAHQ